MTRKRDLPGPSFANRFWAKAKAGELCRLVWTGTRIGNGYGTMYPGGGRNIVYAHRASWELHYGPIPPGLYVCHTCDRGPDGCVTPEHLFLGTHAENQADMGRKGRAGGRKLTNDQVIEIRRLHAAGTKGAVLARRYGVSQSTMSRLVRGEEYKYV